MLRSGSLVLLFLLLTGCSMFSNRPLPDDLVDLPENWSSSSEEGKNLSEGWLKEFGYPKLSALVQEAFNKNPTLESQLAAVKIAQIQSVLAGADRLPQLSSGFGTSRNKRSSTNGYALSSAYNTSYNFSLDLSWEVDVWNRVGNEVKAALYDEVVEDADFKGAQLSLAANITKVWFDGIEAQQQLALSQRTVDNYRSTLQIIERGYDYGLYRALDVRLARSNLLGAVSRQQTYRIVKDDAVRTLEVFLGRYPSASLKFPEKLLTLSEPIQAGIPINLLNRRPDIVAATARYNAQDQRHTAAKKNRLPAIRLAGSSGMTSSDLTDLVDTDFLVWNFVSGITQPLFQGGRLDALRDEAAIRLQQAEADYKQTVLQAFKEVETLLSSAKWLHIQEKSLVETTLETTEAELLANEDYISGLTDINTLLQTQRDAFVAESSLLAVKKARLQNRVNLYLALGGEVIADSTVTSKELPLIKKN